jgi:hypothetical protein
MAKRTKSSALEATIDDHIERLIDQALEYTFPASDPPAIAVEALLRRAMSMHTSGRRVATPLPETLAEPLCRHGELL